MERLVSEQRMQAKQCKLTDILSIIEILAFILIQPMGDLRGQQYLGCADMISNVVGQEKQNISKECVMCFSERPNVTPVVDVLLGQNCDVLCVLTTLFFLCENTKCKPALLLKY